MIRTLILPAALVAGLGLASAHRAEASPLSASHAVTAPYALGGLRIGIGVGIPIGGGHRHTVPTGYWTTQTVPTTVAVQVPYQVTVQVPVQVAVQVPDRVVGTDVYGQPIWSYRTEYRTELRNEVRTQYRLEYQTQYVTQQVWVPTGYASYPSQPWGRVGVGVGFRIR